MSNYVSHHPTIGDIISNRYLVTGDVKQIPNSRDINPNPWCMTFTQNDVPKRCHWPDSPSGTSIPYPFGPIGRVPQTFRWCCRSAIIFLALRIQFLKNDVCKLGLDIFHESIKFLWFCSHFNYPLVIKNSAMGNSLWMVLLFGEKNHKSSTRWCPNT